MMITHSLAYLTYYKNQDGGQWQRDGDDHVYRNDQSTDFDKTVSQQRTEKLGDDFRCGMTDCILDRSLQVYEYLATLLNAFHSRSEVVIEENHIGGFLRHVRT